jgi:hypothetical protein
MKAFFFQVHRFFCLRRKDFKTCQCQKFLHLWLFHADRSEIAAAQCIAKSVKVLPGNDFKSFAIIYINVDFCSVGCTRLCFALIDKENMLTGC